MGEATLGMPAGIDLNAEPDSGQSVDSTTPPVSQQETKPNAAVPVATPGDVAPVAASPPGAAAPGPGGSALPTDGAQPSSAAPDADPGAKWYSGMSDDLKAVAAKFGTPEELARSYQNLESMSGTSIRIPGEDASAEDRQAFLSKLTKAAPDLMVKPNDEGDNKQEVYRSLGMPENADGYPKIEGQNPEEIKAFQDMALKANLTGDQYLGMIEEATRMGEVNEQEAQAAFSRDVAELKNEWGTAYGDRYRAAAEVAKRTGAPAGVNELFQNGTINTDTIKWMYKLHQAFGNEGGELSLQPAGGQINEGPSEAKEKLNEIYGNREHPYWHSSHPGNADAIKRVLTLQKQANPGMSDDPALLRGSAAPPIAPH